MRQLAIVLLIAASTLGCNPVVDPDCFDGDMDGVCFADDSDDGNASCGADGTDADGDAHCVGFDCDDSAATGAGCVDGCTDVWADADGDGFGDANAVLGACMLGGPGVVTPGGLADCDDTPGTGRTRVPIDFDGDGANACDDCDELDVRVYGGNEERCDGGLDNDCDPATDETTGDPDGDGILGCADLCPMQAALPSEIVWEWVETNTTFQGGTCGSCATPGAPVTTGSYDFKINGASVGTAMSVSPQCTCAPAMQSLTTPATGWVATQPANQLAFAFTLASTTTNNLLGWVRARVRYATGEERTICVFDFVGGDCTRAELCTSGPNGGTGFCDPSATCPTYPACDQTMFNESIAAGQFDGDGDGAGSTCDCNDRSPAQSPERLELCTNNLDDDCDGLADAMDDECAVCSRTTLSEANLCGNMLDDDCDGDVDGADADCTGTTCAGAQPIQLLRDGTHERRTGSFDLCRMAPDDTMTAVCGGAEAQRDHWQLVTVHDPLEQGYRLQYCFDGQPGEVLTAESPFTCGNELACGKVFMTGGPNNCVTEPTMGSFKGTRTIPLVFRGLPGCTAGGATVSYRITALPP